MNYLEIIKKIDDLEDKFIVVGVSAGPDSMALLHMLTNNTSKKVVCAHINHKLRKESNEEEKYLKEYCKNNNIIFENTEIASYDTNNIESEARNKRYQFFETILKKYNSHYLILAHHGDDLIETVLMKIMRGSNLEGYAGIKTYAKQKDYTIIRPLLDITKDDIISYNKLHNIKYYIDKTNVDNTYTRNRYRNNVLPFLKQEDKFAHIKFLKYSNTLQEYYNYVKKITKEKINNYYKDNIIDINIFNKEDYFIQKHIIYFLLSNIYDNKANIIKENHIESIIALAKNQKPNAKVNLPNDYIAKKIYDKIYLCKNTSNNKDYIIELKKHNKINNIIIDIVDNYPENGNDVCRLNTNNIKLPLYIRNRHTGDYIQLFGTNGKKNVSDIFIEKKISLEERDNYPILTDSNDNILWIPFLKKSKYNVKKDEKYDIILTSYKEGVKKNEEKN